MAQPPPYTPATDFSDDELDNVSGRSTVRTSELDGEFSALATTIAAIRANLSLNQRDDGEIRDARVKLHTLGADVRALLAVGNVTASNLKGDWLTATAYIKLDVVTQSSNTYICAIAHTSGTFATDLTADRWLLLAQGATAASAIAFTPTATIAATNAQAAIEEADTENRTLSAAVQTNLTTSISNLADTSDVAKGDALVGVKSTLTGGVARTQHGKNAEVVSPFDFMSGAEQNDVTAGTLGVDVTTALTAAFAAAVANGLTLQLPRGKFGVTSVAQQWNTSSGPITANIRGAGLRATTIQKLGGTTTAVLALTTNALGNGVYSNLTGFSVIGNASCPGITATGFAGLDTRALRISTSTIGLDYIGSLIASNYNLILEGNATGFRSRVSAGNYANILNFFGGRAQLNTTTAYDIGDSSACDFYGVDIEENGTTADLTTAGVIIRSTCGGEFQAGNINFHGGTWFEANKGTSLLVESATYLALSLHGTVFANNPANRAINCGAIRSLLIDSCSNNSSGDAYTIGATQNTHIRGGTANTVTDSSLNFTYEDVMIGGVSVPYRSGGASKPTMNRNGGTQNSGTSNAAGVLTGVATTMFTVSGATPRMYRVFVCLGGAGTAFMATAVFGWDGTNLVRSDGGNGASMTLTASGANVQATQSSGSTQTVFYVYDIIA